MGIGLTVAGGAWLALRRDPGSGSGFKDPAGTRDKPFLWQSNLVVDGSGDLAADDSALYLANDDRQLIALDTAAGKQLWRNDDAVAKMESARLVRAGGHLYAYGGFSDKNRHCHLVALNPATGKPLWHRDFQYSAGPAQPILLEKGLLIGFHEGYVHCVDPADGDDVWQVDGGAFAAGNYIDHLGATPGGSVIASVQWAKNGGAVLGIRPGGGLTEWLADPGRSEWPVPSAWATEPHYRAGVHWLAVASDDLAHAVCKVAGGAELVAFNPLNGQLRWRLSAALCSSPILREGTMYAAVLEQSGTAAVLALNAATGKVAWRCEANADLLTTRVGNITYASLAAGDDGICAASDEGLIFAGLADGKPRAQVAAPPDMSFENSSMLAIGHVLHIVRHGPQGDAVDRFDMSNGQAIEPIKLSGHGHMLAQTKAGVMLTTSEGTFRLAI
ncbi:PQQ-like beta-propeller repeat protein [Catelliglobosispora koreensis]|uniref:PQQ-like beta-propeller repeat protein n=1 Tax=Catelliglobosispora koreensis TaxID=129052 RepID=UPI00146D261E|nr:PQQ-like beta-propeller repeat protein [Catelliglobosispora koreensis]